MMRVPATVDRLAVGAAGPGADSVGTVLLPLSIPDPRAAIVLGGILLGWPGPVDALSDEDTLPFSPSLERRFSAERPPHAYVAVQWRGQADVPLAATVVVRRGPDVLRRQPLFLRAATTEDDGPHLQSAILNVVVPIAGLPDGWYDLDVEARHRDGASASRTVAVEVVDR
jgi:hypothetical protein